MEKGLAAQADDLSFLSGIHMVKNKWKKLIPERCPPISTFTYTINEINTMSYINNYHESQKYIVSLNPGIYTFTTEIIVIIYLVERGSPFL